MTNVISNKDIEYTLGDTFTLPITPTSDGEFTTEMQLKLTIAENEQSESVIEKTFNILSDLTFLITLTDTESAKLNLGNYIYKMTVIDGVKICTEKSGNFTVKWGA